MAETTVLNILKVFMILIFAGWISLWLLKPTQLWTKKWHRIEDSSKTTIFGYYGLNFAVYTFPIIALAIIGSIYLNLKQQRRRQRRICWAAGLSNPLVVNTFLGTLSIIEILAVSLFVLFLAWTFYARISNDFNKLMPYKGLNLNRWQLKYLRVATRFGLLAEACLALLLLPILRWLAVFRLLGIQFEASVRYHIWLGTALIFFATFHGLSTLFIWGISHHIQNEVWKWQKTGRIYLAGEITLLSGLVIWITALPQIRRKWFQLFYYTHHLYIVFLVFFLFHAGDRHFYMVFAGIFLFGLDKLLRIIQSRPQTCILSAKIFPCKAIQLTLPKHPRLKYIPTSVIYVKVPSLSKFQWHPFSIASSSSIDDKTMSVILKCEGSWTSSLYHLIQNQQDSYNDQVKNIPIAVEGPYGPSSMDFLRYDSLLLVAGGIGITPFLSILQEIASSQNSTTFGISTRIQLIYVVKKSEDICLLNSVSPLILDQSTEPLRLKLKVFVTQEEQSAALTVRELVNEVSQVQTVQFSTDGLNYPLMGLGNSLWIAAITGFSCVVFLVFLICFNRIFVPEDKKQSKSSKEKNPSSIADLLLMLSFIIAIICGMLVALAIRWRNLKKETNPVFEKEVKISKPRLTEERRTTEEHDIHFGGRPNFQDILTKFPNESGGANIGVLVCGPETMKESVASAIQQTSQCVNVGAKKTVKFSFHSLNFTL